MTGMTTNGVRYPDGANHPKTFGADMRQLAEDIDQLVFEGSGHIAETIVQLEVTRQIEDSTIIDEAAAAAVNTALIQGGLKKTTLQQVQLMFGGRTERNLFPDPSAERNPAALVASSGAVNVSQSSQWGEEGKSWYVQNSTNATVPAASAHSHQIDGASVVTIGARFFNWLGATRGFAVGAAFLDAAGNGLGQYWGAAVAVLSGGRQYAWGSFAVPPGATQFKAMVARVAGGANPSDASDTWFVANIYAGVGIDHPTLPLDGDQLMTYWDGTPGQSPSVRVIPALGDSATKSLLSQCAAWGDSMTEQNWMEAVAAATGAEWHNGGRSGQTSGAIAYRQGGVQLRTQTSVNLPASGTVTIAVRSLIVPWVYANSGTLSGVLDGESVTFTQVSGSHTNGEFLIAVTRTTPGIARTIGAGATLRSAEGDAYRDCLQTFQVGRNDSVFGSPDHVTGVVAAVTAMRDHLSPDVKRFLVISVLTSTSETTGAVGAAAASRKAVLDENAALAEAFPGEYVDLRRHVIDNALSILGITPTADDLAAIAGDTIPPSVTPDGVHLSADAVARVEAPYLVRQLLARTWTP